jgi:hypothetical protein
MFFFGSTSTTNDCLFHFHSSSFLYSLSNNLIYTLHKYFERANVHSTLGSCFYTKPAWICTPDNIIQYNAIFLPNLTWLPWHPQDGESWKGLTPSMVVSCLDFAGEAFNLGWKTYAMMMIWSFSTRWPRLPLGMVIVRVFGMILGQMDSAPSALPHHFFSVELECQAIHC